VDFFHWANGVLVDVDAIGNTEWPQDKEIWIGIADGVDHSKDVVYLIHKSSEVVNNVLEVVHVIVESSQDGSCWGNIKEFVDWSFHNWVESFSVNTLQGIADDSLDKVLSYTVD